MQKFMDGKLLNYLMIKKIFYFLTNLSLNKKKILKPKVFRKKDHGINKNYLSQNAIEVIKTLQNYGFKSFVVGGAVRDILLDLKPKDFDIGTNAKPEEIKNLFKRAFIIGRRFKLVHVMFGHEKIEVTTFRGNSNKNSVKDEHGRVLRDNEFGENHEDAERRDFTINAMYYDPTKEIILDYHNGLQDISNKVLRIIGNPEARYREDPVRILRAFRFAAKLNLKISHKTKAPIRILAPLINNVPVARVFDELIKIITSGDSLDCIKKIKREGIDGKILPMLDIILDQPLNDKFTILFFNKTDSRVKSGKSISPSFLFAALLWKKVLKRVEINKNTKEHSISILNQAIRIVLNEQSEKLHLHRKIISDVKEIWFMQLRFERKSKKSPFKILQHSKLRTSYNFLLLRCESGEIDNKVGEWWKSFIESDDSGRKELLSKKNKSLSQRNLSKKFKNKNLNN